MEERRGQRDQAGAPERIGSVRREDPKLAPSVDQELLDIGEALVGLELPLAQASLLFTHAAHLGSESAHLLTNVDERSDSWALEIHARSARPGALLECARVAFVAFVLKTTEALLSSARGFLIVFDVVTRLPEARYEEGVDPFEISRRNVISFLSCA